MFLLFAGRIYLIYSMKITQYSSSFNHIPEEVFHMKKLATLFSSVYPPSEGQHHTRKHV